MKKSSEAGSASGGSGVLRISPLGKLDERKLVPGAAAFKRGAKSDFFDIGTMVWGKVLEHGNMASRSSDDPYLRAFPQAAAKFAWASETLPGAEDLVVSYFSIRAAAESFAARLPGWKISPSTGLLHESNAYDANEIDLADAFRLTEKADTDMLFRAVFAEMREIPDFDSYSTVVFDFFWPAGLYQVFPIAKKMKELGKKTVLNFTRANEQSDFTVWIEAFKKNPEIFSVLDAVVIYEDYGHALDTVVEAFRSGHELPRDIENVVRIENGAVAFSKPKPPPPEELFRRFEAYFHSGAKERPIGGRKIATIRLFPYRCYWSSCFFCTINSTHLYAYEKNRSEYVGSCLDYVEKNDIRYLYLADEAIDPDDILAFASKALERKLDLVYRFRARFDSRFDDAACELLYRSGARYVGIGLECASDRVSELINKGNELSLKEKTRIIDSFEQAGIPFHNYAILGLPGERQDEMYETFLFLSKNVRQRKNYTCSPNVFGLNKGSVYEKHGEKFGVEVVNKPVSKTSLSLRVEMARSALFSDSQKQFALELHRQQFLEFCSPELASGTVLRDFWDFVDRTGMFYHLKSFFAESPYRLPVREVAELSGTDFETLLDSEFRLSEYLVREPGEGVNLRNLSTGYRISVQNASGFLPENWKNGAPLRENFPEIFSVPADESAVRSMIAARIILPAHD